MTEIVIVRALSLLLIEIVQNGSSFDPCHVTLIHFPTQTPQSVGWKLPRGKGREGTKKHERKMRLTESVRYGATVLVVEKERSKMEELTSRVYNNLGE